MEGQGRLSEDLVHDGACLLQAGLGFTLAVHTHILCGETAKQALQGEDQQWNRVLLHMFVFDHLGFFLLRPQLKHHTHPCQSSRGFLDNHHLAGEESDDAIFVILSGNPPIECQQKRSGYLRV